MGLFITVEGIDGSGKTTFAKALIDALNNSELISEKYFSGVVLNREPTNGFYGSRVRNMLTGDVKSTNWKWEKALLFVLDRAEDVERFIAPNLNENKIVILDRYIHSQLAYQTAEGLDSTLLVKLNKDFPQPNIVFYLDIDPKLALERIKDRINKSYLSKLTVFERLQFLGLVAKNYKRFIDNKVLAKRFVILDASYTTERLVKRAIKEIKKVSDDLIKWSEKKKVYLTDFLT